MYKKKEGSKVWEGRRVFAFRLSLVLEWGVCLCRMLLLLQTGSEDPVYMCQRAVERGKREKERAVRDGGSTFGP